VVYLCDARTLVHHSTDFSLPCGRRILRRPEFVSQNLVLVLQYGRSVIGLEYSSPSKRSEFRSTTNMCGSDTELSVRDSTSEWCPAPTKYDTWYRYLYPSTPMKTPAHRTGSCRPQVIHNPAEVLEKQVIDYHHDTVKQCLPNLREPCVLPPPAHRVWRLCKFKVSVRVNLVITTAAFCSNLGIAPTWWTGLLQIHPPTHSRSDFGGHRASLCTEIPSEG
jgi:hypothetical protein